MKNLRRILNQNLVFIVIAVIAIVCIILVINAIGEVSAQRLQEQADKNKNVINTQNTIETPNQSIVTQQIISPTKANSDMELINTFVGYCNTQEIQKAYDMLTQDCKDQMYPSVEIFYQNYAKIVFDKKRVANSQSWLVLYPMYIYKVRMSPDIMAQGQYDAKDVYQDYYTVITKDGVDKLSINQYVYKLPMKVEKEYANIKMTLEGRDVYTKEEVYRIKIENNTGVTIKLDSKQQGNTTYLVDDKGAKGLSHMYQIPDNSLILKNGAYTYITLRFNKPLSSNNLTNKIVFSDIIIDYDQYMQQANKAQYKNRISFSILM